MSMRGFTLIELVIVMAIMAIVSMFSLQFITKSIQIYKQGSDREQLMSDIRFGIERLNREVRNAVPGSLRLETPDGTANEPIAECVRFWTIELGRRYSNIITTSTDTQVTMSAGDLTGSDIGAYFKDNWLVIFPTGLDSSTHSCADNIDCAVKITTPPAFSITPAELIFTFPKKLNFANSSFKRVFFAKEQVRYCVADKKLTRATAMIDGVFSQPIPMADNIERGAFIIGNEDLYPMLGFDLTANKNNETIQFSHKIRLYNAP